MGMWCKERGETSEKTFSGNLRLRMSYELRAHLALEAIKKDISLNNEKLQKI